MRRRLGNRLGSMRLGQVGSFMNRTRGEDVDIVLSLRGCTQHCRRKIGYVVNAGKMALSRFTSF